MSDFGRSKGSFGSSRYGGGGGGGRRNLPVCYFCHKRGHFGEYCWSNPDSANFKPRRNSLNSYHNSKNSTLNESDNSSLKDQSKEIDIVTSKDGTEQLSATILNEANEVAENVSDSLDAKMVSPMIKISKVEPVEVSDTVTEPLVKEADSATPNDAGVLSTASQCDDVSANNVTQSIKLFGSTPLKTTDNFAATLMVEHTSKDKRRISLEIIETLPPRTDTHVEESDRSSAALTPVKTDEEPKHVEIESKADVASNNESTMHECDNSPLKDQSNEIDSVTSKDSTEQLSTTLKEANEGAENASDSLDAKMSSPTIEISKVESVEIPDTDTEPLDNEADSAMPNVAGVSSIAAQCDDVLANNAEHSLFDSTPHKSTNHEIESNDDVASNIDTYVEDRSTAALTPVKTDDGLKNVEIESKADVARNKLRYHKEITASNWEALKSGYDKKIQFLDEKIQEVDAMTQTLCKKTVQLNRYKLKLIKQGIDPDSVEETSDVNKSSDQQIFESSMRQQFAASASHPFGLSSHNAFASSTYGFPPPLGYPMVPPNTPVVMPVYPPAMMYPFGMSYGLPMQGYGYPAQLPFDQSAIMAQHHSASAAYDNEDDYDQETD